VTAGTAPSAVRSGRSPAAGWNTELVERTDRRAPTGPTAARLILLAAVLAGLFGMHVLTAEDGTSRHGALPMISAAGPHGVTSHDPIPADTMPAMDATGVLAGGAVVASTTFAPTDPAPGGDHGSMTGCILFLVIGGAALILLLLHHRNTSNTTRSGRLPGPVLTEIRRRGPPVRWPRLALCVIRV